jgi:hypothetical protein
MAKRVLLIDGDQFLFKASIAVEKETKWDDQNHVLYSNSNEAWDVLVGMLDRIFERFETKEHALTFSAPPNFRFDVGPTTRDTATPGNPSATRHSVRRSRASTTAWPWRAWRLMT